MAERFPFCYLLGTANNFLVVGLCKMGFMNFVSQVTGRTDAKCCVSSSSAPESMSSSARMVKKLEASFCNWIFFFLNSLYVPTVSLCKISMFWQQNDPLCRCFLYHLGQFDTAR